MGGGCEVSPKGFNYGITIRDSYWPPALGRGKLLRSWGKRMNDYFTSASDTSSAQVNKRTVPRYTFIATVDIVEPVTDTHFSGRISEISRKGCYLDILNTLPKGTVIHLMVSRDKGTFVTAGKIIYVQDGVGMGVAFTDTQPDQLAILDSWIDELKS